MIGKIFGELVVIDYSHNDKHQNKMWNCLCSCGKSTKVRTTDLNKGHTKSCGCKQYRKGRDVYNYTGYEDITGARWYSIREGAKNRGLEFSITKKDVWDMFLKQKRKCSFTGLLLSFSDSSASIDRIDNDKGYTIDNISIVHKDINLMRNKFSVDYFKEMCKYVAQH